MWTPTSRARHDRHHLRYGSDLTDEELAVAGAFASTACQDRTPSALADARIIYHQLSSIIINYHNYQKLSSIIINYHQLSSIIINYHQLSSIIIFIIIYHKLSSIITNYHNLS